MKVILFGATGMVGQGVLRECLLAPDVESVVVVGRSPTGQAHEKLHEIVHTDLFDLSPIADQLTGADACFFCLGVSSVGMKEAEYRRVTHDMTLAVANELIGRNPAMTFIYVSGAGTDSTGQGRLMWARVKGETENALRKLPFKATYMFRPALIQPLHGVTSRFVSYKIFYGLSRPLYPLLQAALPGYQTSTERIGRAMLNVVRHGFAKPILESRDINELSKDLATP